MPHETSIEKIGEVQRVNNKGALEQQMEIVFHVGDDGPFRIIMPSSEFSEVKARSAMVERAAEIRKLREGDKTA
jgi:hypothetical protein